MIAYLSHNHLNDMGFFELVTARDMLEKAKREYIRLCDELNIDNVFNFFVTAYHIRDYLDKTNAVSQKDLDNFLNDFSIQACHDLCDKGKHMRLTKKYRIDPDTVIYNGALNGAPLGEMALSGGDRWMVFCGGREFEIEILAENIIKSGKIFS